MPPVAFNIKIGTNRSAETHACDEPEDLVAHFPIVGALTELGDCPGELDADDLGRARRGRVVAYERG